MKKITKIITVFLAVLLLACIGLSCFADGALTSVGDYSRTHYSLAPETVYAVLTNEDSTQTQLGFDAAVPYVFAECSFYTRYNNVPNNLSYVATLAANSSLVNGEYKFAYEFGYGGPYTAIAYNILKMRDFVLTDTSIGYLKRNGATFSTTAKIITVLDNVVTSHDYAYEFTTNSSTAYDLIGNIKESYDPADYDYIFVKDCFITVGNPTYLNIEIRTNVGIDFDSTYAEAMENIDGSGGDSLLGQIGNFLVDFADIFVELVATTTLLFYDNGLTLIGVLALCMLGLSLCFLFVRYLRAFFNFND